MVRIGAAPRRSIASGERHHWRLARQESCPASARAAQEQFAPGALPVVFYENLVRAPETELPYVFRMAGLDYDQATLARVSRLSATTTANSAVLTGADRTARWKNELSTRQIDDILAVVDGFGLGNLYGDAGEPISGGRQLS